MPVHTRRHLSQATLMHLNLRITVFVIGKEEIYLFYVSSEEEEVAMHSLFRTLSLMRTAVITNLETWGYMFNETLKHICAVSPDFCLENCWKHRRGGLGISHSVWFSIRYFFFAFWFCLSFSGSFSYLFLSVRINMYLRLFFLHSASSLGTLMHLDPEI